MAGSDFKWDPLRRLLPAVQPKLAVLDRAYAIDRRRLVFGAKFKTAMVAQPAARVRRRNRFLYGRF